MATKADFTGDQWLTLVFAMEDTMTFVSLSNGVHFFESMGEATATARFLNEQHKAATSTLVRDLSTGAGMHRDKEVGRDPAQMESAVLSRVAEAVETVRTVAPDELDAFKAFLIGVADATAEARNGIDDAEQTAIDKIKSALV